MENLLEIVHLMYIILCTMYFVANIALISFCYFWEKLSLEKILTTKIIFLILLLSTVLALSCVCRSIIIYNESVLINACLDSLSYLLFCGGLFIHSSMLYIRTHKILLPENFHKPLIWTISIFGITSFGLSFVVGLYHYYNTEILRISYEVLTSLVGLIFFFADVTFTFVFTRYCFFERRLHIAGEEDTTIVLIARRFLLITCWIWLGLICELLRGYSIFGISEEWREMLIVLIFVVGHGVVIQWIWLKISLFILKKNKKWTEVNTNSSI
jgi:hypothetical protein